MDEFNQEMRELRYELASEADEAAERAREDAYGGGL